jgi:small-conductance mechanosensitive channel
MKKRLDRSIFWKRFMVAPILLVLMLYHFFLSMYLFLAKHVRKSLLFPGG